MSFFMSTGRLCIYFQFFDLMTTNSQDLFVCRPTLIDRKNLKIFSNIVKYFYVFRHKFFLYYFKNTKIFLHAHFLKNTQAFCKYFHDVRRILFDKRNIQSIIFKNTNLSKIHIFMIFLTSIS